jgi:hypothetical protein
MSGRKRYGARLLVPPRSLVHFVGLVGPVGLVAGCYVDHVAGERVSAEVAGSTTAAGATSPTGPTTAADASSSAIDGPGTSTAAGSDDATTATVACEAPTGHAVCDDGPDPFRAIGLGCPGTRFDSTALVRSTLDSPDETAWRLTRELGNAFWSPREGTSLLALTTGTLPLPDASGRIAIPFGQGFAPSGNNGNPDGAALPPPVSTAPGSNGGAGGTPFVGCDGAGDCSDTLPALLPAAGPANDLLALSFEVEVPVGVHGFRVDLVWLSAEFPARVGAPANDAFVWWVSSEAYVGNIATLDGAPMTATGLRPQLLEANLVGNAPALLDTGLGGTTGQPCEYPWAAWAACPRGAASGWLTLDGPANPGEVLGLTAVLYDQGDTELDTLVLLDDWRWHCPGCTPGQDCGLSPADG